MPFPGTWVFVSHANADFEKVRQVRDELEKRGARPLLFYLKALENRSAELPDLLRREIAARDWFVLCNSERAHDSRWVKQEVDMVLSMDGVAFEAIELNGPIEDQIARIESLEKRATVFLSYAHKDEHVADRLRPLLRRGGFEVFNPRASISSGGSWANQLTDAIRETADQGFVIPLLTSSYMSSSWCNHELTFALFQQHEKGITNVVPVIVEDSAGVLAQMPVAAQQLQMFDLTIGKFDDRVRELIVSLRTRRLV